MPKRNHYYDGTEARTIRAFTRRTFIAQLKSILTQAGESAEFPVFSSLASASNAFQRGERFLVAALRPTKTTGCRVLGHDDGAAHSGMQYDWTFLVQLGSGRTGNKTTGEQTTLADDELMDVVRDGLEGRYAAFRDDLLFSNLKVSAEDTGRETGNLLNPMMVTFTNKIRLTTDSFITT